MWEGEIAAFSPPYRAIAPDLLGFTMAGAAQEILKLLDHLQVREPVALIGLSMGGYILFE